MTDQLRNTMLARADRADTSIDIDEVLGAARDRARRRTRRRRTVLAAGGGALIVGTAAVAAVALAPASGSGHRAARTPAAAQLGAVRLAASAQLGRIAPAPAPTRPSTDYAWRHLEPDGTVSTYGTRGLERPGDPQYFAGRFTITVRARHASDGPFPLSVQDRPAGYDAGSRTVTIAMSDSKVVTVQAPSSAHLTEAGTIGLAGTLDLRKIG